MHLKVSLFYCVQLENRIFIGISSIGYLPGNKRFSIAGKITTLVKIIAPENGSSDGSTTNINKFKPIECVVSKMNTLHEKNVITRTHLQFEWRPVYVYASMFATGESMSVYYHLHLRLMEYTRTSICFVLVLPLKQFVLPGM